MAACAQVRYRDVVVGEFVTDLMLEDALILEVKVLRTLSVAHEVQLVNYLTATGFEVGLLLNFGRRLQFRRKVRELVSSQRAPEPQLASSSTRSP